MRKLPGMRGQSLNGLRTMDHTGNLEPKGNLFSVVGLAWRVGVQVEQGGYLCAVATQVKCQNPRRAREVCTFWGWSSHGGQLESSEEAIHTSGKPEACVSVQEEGNPSTGAAGTGRLTRVSTWGNEGSQACGVKT